MREKTKSANGGTRNKIGERWDLIPYSSMRLVAWVFAYGAGIHGDNNWKGSDFDGTEQDPLGRGVRHAFHAMDYPPGSIDRIFQEAKAAWNMIARLWYDAKLYRESHGREPDLAECGGSGGNGDEPKDIQRDSIDIARDFNGRPFPGSNSATGMGGLIWCDECDAYHINDRGGCDKRRAASAISA